MRKEIRGRLEARLQEAQKANKRAEVAAARFWQKAQNSAAPGLNPETVRGSLSAGGLVATTLISWEDKYTWSLWRRAQKKLRRRISRLEKALAPRARRPQAKAGVYGRHFGNAVVDDDYSAGMFSTATWSVTTAAPLPAPLPIDRGYRSIDE